MVVSIAGGAGSNVKLMARQDELSMTRGPPLAPHGNGTMVYPAGQKKEVGAAVGVLVCAQELQRAGQNSNSCIGSQSVTCRVEQNTWSRTPWQVLVGDTDGAYVGVLVVGNIVGGNVGPEVGFLVGDNDGAYVGVLVVGNRVGGNVGPAVGFDVGALVGAVVGRACGAPVGLSVGCTVGPGVGTLLSGDSVGPRVGWSEGFKVGTRVGVLLAGVRVGCDDGLLLAGGREGCSVGSSVGRMVGALLAGDQVGCDVGCTDGPSVGICVGL